MASRATHLRSAARAMVKPVLLALSLATAIGATGCDLLVSDQDVWLGPKPPPVGIPSNIATYWQTNIAFAADPTHGGTPNPGFAGRLYLFGDHLGYPMTGDGKVLVEMYDESKEGTSIKRETWEIDPKTLSRLQRRDKIGWGYTLFLPSAEYKPEITKVRMRATYTPAKGGPLFTESVVTLAENTSTLQSSNRPISFTLPPPPPLQR
jgi:hypothetical protein